MTNIPRPTLYGYFRSTAAYRVRIAANLKGVEVDHRHIHLRKGEQNDEEYRTVNPAGLVPYWVDGELQLAQSLAIIAYLDERYPDPPLLPSDLGARAICREISQAICCDIHPIGNVRVLNRLVEVGVEDGDRAEWSQHWIKLGFDAIEARLARLRGPFAFGSTPTLADICIVPQVYNARRFGVDLEPYSRIREIDATAGFVEAFVTARPDRQADAE
ncbi:maleylacetoacetate isomerase [Bradyrhizobium sp. KB893862 SZCCT0404]|uniref:maleylacetoacetate isomerase n=1 Tax=Bradyrhizobium sp. KB893862 SZCCT0404 TaxID=2807672 RepID=UPI001BA56DFB|nr:maleylacetoacetate isomerase [Bradyrhizobium sp. KB893862 SZCCT0404]MBR1175272.1 maleylacetoacetate isomerase [Bradyrhizobium sp. KB893862 SZCCT0404]